ncbi:hypothetical protein SISNIDRAFT_360267 [Sistotremastrum niveocremeum HHB9708]|uniref:F-box domain-containing protein n=1 Tax=Sistotremastrum niveocremeum HHB9708 TaxID=1314777 RepID=A0A164WQG8_9AGAM|nr:hypothetical protein SISNIDRAFT_360267 [Sistotremastrum niveocremeum HHB9708]
MGRRRITLLKILDMPVEVFLLIAGHLNPLDVLQMSRASRGLRRLLMHPSGRHIWVQARSNIEDLPPCPDKLNEAQYASLLFEHGCQGEDCTSRSTQIHNILLQRLCSSCLQARSSSYLILSQQFPDFGNISKLVPKAKGDQSSIDDFTLERQLLVMKANEEGDRITEWLDLQKRLKREEKDRLIRLRVNSIEERLVDLGYDIDRIPRWRGSWRKLVRKPYKLTDKAWLILEPKLIQLLLPLRPDVPHHQATSLPSSSKIEEPSTSSVIQANFFQDPRKDHIVRTMGTALQCLTVILNTVISQDIVSDESASAASPALQYPFLKSEDGQDWGRMLIFELLSTSSYHQGSASTLFACRDCDTVLSYPEVLFHEHISRILPDAFGAGQRVITTQISDIARVLFHDMFNAHTHYNLSELMAFGTRFACQRCAVELRKPRTWIDLVQHFYDDACWFDGVVGLTEQDRAGHTFFDDHSMTTNAASGHPLCLLLSEAEEAHYVRERQQSATTPESTDCYCTFCNFDYRGWQMTYREATVHLNQKHGIWVDFDACIGRYVT